MRNETRATRIPVGEFLLRRLREAGIENVFGVPGDFKAGSPLILAILSPPARGVEHSHRLAAVAGRLAAQPTRRATGRARLLEPQPSVAHPAAASPSAGEVCFSLGSPRSTCFAARLPASYALRATDAR